MTAMMQAIAQGGAGIDALTIIKTEIPKPAKGEALVRLNAATLNYRDWLFITGALTGLTKEPDYVPLSCGAGEVVAVGDGVTRVKIGDRVSPIFSQVWLTGRMPSMAMLGGSADGTACQFATFDAEGLVLLPDMLGDIEAATLPCAGLTAWNALFQHRPIQSGEWVYCPGTGGVSLAAMQFAKAAGAHVIITSSSDAKLERAKAMGADVAVNYVKAPDLGAALRSALDGGSVDIVVDVVGRDQLDLNLSLLNPGGIVSTIGMLAAHFTWDDGQLDNPRLGRISVGNRDEHEAMLSFIQKHGIRPVVDKVYDLTRIQDAYRCLESGAFFGKVGLNLL